MSTLILAEPRLSTREDWRRGCERAGLTVLPAANEDQLDALLSWGAPDALVVDRSLAGPSGERVRRLREVAGRGPACLVLALLPTEADRQRLWAAGADWYIHRPAFVSYLPNAVRAMLEAGPWPAGPPPRGAPRALAALPIDYWYGTGAGSGETLNLSEDGMFIETPGPAAAGTLLLLGFTLPRARRWECFARVVWKRGPANGNGYPVGMGVRFVDLDPEAQEVLAAVVRAARTAPLLAA